jgi:hypothetical protein
MSSQDAIFLLYTALSGYSLEPDRLAVSSCH